MPRTSSQNEIEIKLRVDDLDAIRARLKRLRARKTVPRTHELNTLYDTPKQELRRRGQLLRIRVEHPARRRDKNHEVESRPAILTYKGPAASKSRPRFKIKTEIETPVAPSGEMAAILLALGLLPSFRYEKFRTTYVLPGLRRLKIELDETPIGAFLELEGPPAAIDRAARLLGYGRSDYSTATYGSLHLAECRRLRRKPCDMLFPSTKKSR